MSDELPPRPVVKYDSGGMSMKIKANRLDWEQGTVDSVDVVIDDEEFKLDFKEPEEWDSITNTVLLKLAQKGVKSNNQRIPIPPKEGMEDCPYDTDTTEFRTLMVVAARGPINSQELEKIFGVGKASDITKNPQSAGLIDSVATDGRRSIYFISIEGMKKIISAHGVREWRQKAEDIVADVYEGDAEELKSQKGLDSFTSTSGDKEA